MIRRPLRARGVARGRAGAGRALAARRGELRPPPPGHGRRTRRDGEPCRAQAWRPRESL